MSAEPRQGERWADNRGEVEIGAVFRFRGTGGSVLYYRGADLHQLGLIRFMRDFAPVEQLRERSERQENKIDPNWNVDRELEKALAAPVERSEDPTLEGTVNLNGVSDAVIIGTFPEIAEWCVERFVTDHKGTGQRKDRVWALMREVIALRRLCSGRGEDSR